jgi:3-hydroxyacyl-CoA dehydrogenase
VPCVPQEIQLPGIGGKMALLNAVKGFVLQGLATEYDAVIGEKLAHILTGGDRPSIHTTTEQHVLDLEREAFLSLCGMEKTQARIQHMLMKGKPLRN